MRKIIILIMFAIICPQVMASSNGAFLDKIENSVFGYTFSNEDDTARLNRIEESVYGQISKGQISTRIAKLKKDISADEIGHEISPKEDTFREDEDSWVFAQEPAEAAKMDYPAIDELERSVFKQEFKTKNIKDRLTSLEIKTFGKSYENDDLANRTDRLKAKIKPQRFMDNMIAQQENDFYTDKVGQLESDYHLNSYGNTDFDYDLYNDNAYNNYNQRQQIFRSKPINISTIEKTLYKTKFENEPMTARLSRIESSVFGTTFNADSDEERISRIQSAINAQKSAKRYDSNRFSQNMATAFQIGTLILMVLACIL